MLELLEEEAELLEELVELVEVDEEEEKLPSVAVIPGNSTNGVTPLAAFAGPLLAKLTPAGSAPISPFA